MEELIVTLNALRDREHRDRRFFAALQGVDIDADSSESEKESDIANLKGFAANEEGFGIGMGLGYTSQGGDLVNDIVS